MNILSTITKDEDLKVAVVKYNKDGCGYNYKFYPEIIKDLKEGDVVVVVNKDGTTHIVTVCKIMDYSDNASCWVVDKLDVVRIKQNYYKQEGIQANINIGE